MSSERQTLVNVNLSRVKLTEREKICAASESCMSPEIVYTNLDVLIKHVLTSRFFL
jgi:hypothetical protein